ncbi:MAG: hypothetical protein GY807_12245 [Gammaproteobacteria bacterium]|nr:hypothetical protein [Gammaproteobacteria bacterium]
MRYENGPPLGKERQTGNFEALADGFYNPVHTNHSKLIQHLPYPVRLIARRYRLPAHIARQICELAKIGGGHEE